VPSRRRLEGSGVAATVLEIFSVQSKAWTQFAVVPTVEQTSPLENGGTRESFSEYAPRDIAFWKVPVSKRVPVVRLRLVSQFWPVFDVAKRKHTLVPAKTAEPKVNVSPSSVKGVNDKVAFDVRIVGLVIEKLPALLLKL